MPIHRAVYYFLMLFKTHDLKKINIKVGKCARLIFQFIKAELRYIIHCIPQC